LEETKKNNIIGIIITVLSVSIAVFHIITSVMGPIDMIRQRSLHLTVIAIICFLVSGEKMEKKVFKYISYLLAVAVAIGGFYVFMEGNAMQFRAGAPNQLDLVIGIVYILVIVEAVRRSSGNAMAIICLFFLVYTMYGPYFPGFLKHAGYSVKQIVNAQFMEMNGLWGTALGMSATYIIIFVIFGEFLNQVGITELFLEFANKIMAKMIGAAAKASVIISALVGMITGSAAASVMIAGSMTVPGMKKSGYSSEFTGVVQAIGGTGGQLMPPIMGSAAFLIAANLGIPYIDVCVAAIIPALLYYFCLFMIVQYTSQELKMGTISEEELKGITWAGILKKSYMIVPVILLTYLLMNGSSPMYAGFIGVLSLFIIGLINKQNRWTIQKLVGALVDSIKSSLSVVTSCAAAGIIVGCVMQSGLGYTISASLVRISGGNIYVLAFLILIASLILGMGMTTVGAYIIVSSLVSPALIKLGIEPIVAHMFPFYFAILSAITPPVAVAAYAAAGITNSNPWNVGIKAFVLSVPIFLVPFVFLIKPELLFIGTITQTLTSTLATALGIAVFTGGTIGFVFRKLRVFERIVLLITGLLLLLPIVLLQVIALIIALAMFFIFKKQSIKLDESSI
jgi:TRAP transporter 4TM/12TM fusion protein